MPSVTLGHRDGDRITISVLDRMHKGASDYWDGNWLVSPVEFTVGAYCGTIGAGLRVEELIGLRRQLETAYAEHGGAARLASMEEWVDLTIEVSESGDVEIQGNFVDQPGYGNRLAFTIAGLDRTALPDVIGALLEIEDAFPILGA